MAAAASGTASAAAVAVAVATVAADKGPALAAAAGMAPAESPLVAAAVAGVAGVAGVAAGMLAVAADQPVLLCGGPLANLQQTGDSSCTIMVEGAACVTLSRLPKACQLV